MQTSLNQQQKLALQDKQLLKEYKAEIKYLKPLAMPSHEVEKDVSSQSDTEQEAELVKEKTQTKKWWQFKKRGQKND